MNIPNKMVKHFAHQILGFEFYNSIILIILMLTQNISFAQDPSNIVLNQGTIVGLKIFPDTSRTPIYSFLGIPYAQPPIGKLRFTLPEPHPGWNKTLYARGFQPICPQLENSIYDEVKNIYPVRSQTDENCLYLNIWTPEPALRYGTGTAPVLVIITGEEQAFDWTINRPSGLDLAGEGIIVITVQSRTGILGWLSLDMDISPGNLGLHDQWLALKWIRENIIKFGGDAKQITLLGHGTSGATNAMLHLISPRTKGFLSKLICMSGTVFSPWSFQLVRPKDNPSTKIIRILACDSINSNFTLQCLQRKSLTDIMKAYELIYMNGNYSVMLGPQRDQYVIRSKQYIPDDPREMIRHKRFPNIPIMMGICSNEGAFMQDQWLEIAREGFEPLNKYIYLTVIPNIIENYKRSMSVDITNQTVDIIKWNFFNMAKGKNIPNLLGSLQKLLTETKFETPFLQTIEVFSSNPSRNQSALYVYMFQQPKSIDMRGQINYFGGASHSSDLPFLMGPSLFQQISRRKLSQTEDKLCKKIRQYFTDFVKIGNPTSGRLFDSWSPYSENQKFIQSLGGDVMGKTNSYQEQYSSQINQLLNRDTDETKVMSNGILLNPYTIGSIVNEGSVINDNSGRTPKSYMNSMNSKQYDQLSKVHSFWTVLLPNLANYTRFEVESVKTIGDDKNENEIQYLENETPHYKHAFISMLVLVCLLLTVLCICVYILKKNKQSIDTTFL